MCDTSFFLFMIVYVAQVIPVFVYYLSQVSIKIQSKVLINICTRWSIYLETRFMILHQVISRRNKFYICFEQPGPEVKIQRMN